MSNPFSDQLVNEAPEPIQATVVRDTSAQVASEGVPLSALFLGLSAAGTICGLLSTCVSEERELPVLPLLIVSVGFATGSAIVVFLFTFSRQATLIGAVVALIASATVILLTSSLPTENFGQAMLTSAIGCAVMVIVAIVGRRKNAARSVSGVVNSGLEKEKTAT